MLIYCVHIVYQDNTASMLSGNWAHAGVVTKAPPVQLNTTTHVQHQATPKPAVTKAKAPPPPFVEDMDPWNDFSQEHPEPIIELVTPVVAMARSNSPGRVHGMEWSHSWDHDQDWWTPTYYRRQSSQALNGLFVLAFVGKFALSLSEVNVPKSKTPELQSLEAQPTAPNPPSQPQTPKSLTPKLQFLEPLTPKPVPPDLA